MGKQINTSDLQFLIQKGFKTFKNENTIINEVIPDLVSDKLNVYIPEDSDATAYNLRDDYTGRGSKDFMIEGFETQKGGFKLESRDYYTGLSRKRLRDISDFYNNEAEAGRVIVNKFMDGMSKRKRLIKENDIATMLKNENNYEAKNILDLSTNKVKEWTSTEIADFIEGISLIKKNLDLAVGGGLINDKADYSNNTDIKTVMFLPYDVFVQMQANLKAFNEYISFNGNNGNYRYVTVEMLSVLFGLDVYIGNGFKLKQKAELSNVYDIDNMEYIWSSPQVYITTASSNPLDMSGIKYIRYKDEGMYQKEDMGDMLFLSENISMPYLNNKNANALVKVKIA